MFSAEVPRPRVADAVSSVAVHKAPVENDLLADNSVYV